MTGRSVAAVAGGSSAGRYGRLASAVLALALASCAHHHIAPPPPPPPPPPPVAIVIPPRPTPPDGSAPNLTIPPIEDDGVRESVNRKVSITQQVWNLRSAYTVAALDCREPRHSAILPLYRLFLEHNADVLKATYTEIDREFRHRFGTGGETLRDSYLTVLYNHYALPPTKPTFCDVVLQVMQDGTDVAPEDLGTFAAAELPVIEKVFDDFFDRYDKYRNALAEWEERYGHGGHLTIEPLAQKPSLPTPAPATDKVQSAAP